MNDDVNITELPSLLWRGCHLRDRLTEEKLWLTTGVRVLLYREIIWPLRYTINYIVWKRHLSRLTTSKGLIFIQSNLEAFLKICQQIIQVLF